MFKKLLIVISIALYSLPASTTAKVRIFACEPEWASLCIEIGGDRINVYSATTANQDPHYIRAKPGLIAKMRKSDLVIGSGASLEAGWLPILLRKSGNPKTSPGGIGYLMASDYVPIFGRTSKADRSHGDIHPEGNPHVHLDPNNISLVADELVKRLALIEPENQLYFQKQHKIFSERWRAEIARWEKFTEKFRDKPVAVHHTSFTYLENWLGLRRIATLEPKPGLPPTTSHLKSLLKTLRGNPARVILRAPYTRDKGSIWLSDKTGIPALELPYTIGGDHHCSDLFTLYDRTLELLSEALDDE